MGVRTVHGCVQYMGKNGSNLHKIESNGFKGVPAV